MRRSEGFYLPVASSVACDERSDADDGVVDVLRKLVSDRFTDLIVSLAVEPIRSGKTPEIGNGLKVPYDDEMSLSPPIELKPKTDWTIENASHEAACWLKHS